MFLAHTFCQYFHEFFRVSGMELGVMTVSPECGSNSSRVGTHKVIPLFHVLEAHWAQAIAQPLLQMVRSSVPDFISSHIGLPKCSLPVDIRDVSERE